MELKLQKRLAAGMLKCSPKKVWFDENHLDEIKEAITKADIRASINKGLIQIKPVKSASRTRARKDAVQKRKGRRKGQGTRKGRSTARLSKKEFWTNAIRAQRGLIRYLRDTEKISRNTYRNLYLKCKGGFFRSRRHIKLFIDERGLSKSK
ncbi:MAG: 50S ribosomal protein L19e [Candidatus Woesearchaeota archaeon]